jgi:tetratricopeptide (TPR) repeat protein
MGFRFFRRVKILPGLTLNLSKSGGSLSFGPRGCKYTIGSHGTRMTVGLPGTGLYYTEKLSGTRRKKKSAESIREPLSLGFFEGLFTSGAEKEFIAGCKAFIIEEDIHKAYRIFSGIDDIADAYFLAAYFALNSHNFEKAELYLNEAIKRKDKLGELFSKYHIDMEIKLLITDEVMAYIPPNIVGALLMLVEVLQLQEKVADALNVLKKLQKLSPYDKVVRLSLSELLFEQAVNSPNIAKEILELSSVDENNDSVDTALLLYHGKALMSLSLYTGAKEVFTRGLRRKKGRSEELLLALYYERAKAYQALGQHARSRKDLERIYGRDMSYKNVEELLFK